MIHWFPLSFSVPLPVPTSGMVALYLIIGMLFLLITAGTTLSDARGRPYGYCAVVIDERPWRGLLVTAIVVLAWPLGGWFMLQDLYRYLRRSWRGWLRSTWAAARRLVGRALYWLGDDRVVLVVAVVLLTSNFPGRLIDADWLMAGFDLALGGFLLVGSWRALGRKAVAA